MGNTTVISIKRVLSYFLLLQLVAGCSHQPHPAIEDAILHIPAEGRDESRQYYNELTADLSRDFPFRAGMSVAKVQELIKLNNERVNRLVQEQFESDKTEGVFHPPAFAERDRHLYLFIELSQFELMVGKVPPSPRPAVNFWVNGRHQFFVDMAIEDGRVENIYVSPGNFSTIYPSFRFDGTGKRVGRFADVYEIEGD